MADIKREAMEQADVLKERESRLLDVSEHTARQHDCLKQEQDEMERLARLAVAWNRYGQRSTSLPCLHTLKHHISSSL